MFDLQIKIMAEIDEIIADYRKDIRKLYKDENMVESIKQELIDKYEFFIGNLKMNQRRIIDSIKK